MTTARTGIPLSAALEARIAAYRTSRTGPKLGFPSKTAIILELIEIALDLVETRAAATKA